MSTQVAPNPDDIFSHALKFFSTLNQLHQTSAPERMGAIVEPVAVLSAFTCEVFFKAVICLSSGSVPRSHLLYDLFTKLPVDNQEKLKAAWNANQAARKDILDQLDQSVGRALPRDLEGALKEGTDTFRQIRYSYEGGSDFYFLLSDLPLVLYHVFREIKAEWKVMSNNV